MLQDIGGTFKCFGQFTVVGKAGVPENAKIPPVFIGTLRA
jgi:hypothetical protein